MTQRQSQTERVHPITPAPVTRREDFREVLHGVEVIDPYRWLEDQDSDEMRAWVRAQNEYAHRVIGNLSTLGPFQRRLEELVRVDEISAPDQYGERFFIHKKKPSDELWCLYVRDGLDGEDRLLIDPHGLSSDHTVDTYFKEASSDGRYVVYGVRHGGEDEVELHVRDVETGEDLNDTLPRAVYANVAWLNQTYEGFFYGRYDDAIGPRIYFHRLGADSASDKLVFGEGLGPHLSAWPVVSDDGRFLLLGTSEGWQRSEIFVQDLATGGPITAIAAGVEAQFYGEFAGETLIVRTDLDAPNWKICAVHLTKPALSPDKWPVLVAESVDAIDGLSVAGGKIFVRTLHDVGARIHAYTIEGEPQGELDLPGFGTAFGPWGRWDSDDAFVYFSAYTHPGTFYHYRVSSGETAAWSMQSVPFDGSGFDTHQIWYTSKDGTRIPMTIVHRKDIELDGDRPTLMYGYGGFGVSLTPFFSPRWATWMEHGGVLAVPNIRGGGEFGEDWHRAGKLEKKQNVFDDFIAAAEWLQSNRYSRPARMAIAGGSNGGLLVGAALTQRPELFQAVLCEVPDLDLVGYPRFVLNPPALLEYGDSRIPEHFEFLMRYSPYQRVADETDYPAVLLRTGDADTRVAPLQARKMTARLQAATSSNRPILLLYEEKSGHAGGRPASKIIEDDAQAVAFLAWQLNLRES